MRYNDENYFQFAMYQYHPSGQAFATASEDKSARLFDIRSDQQIANYEPSNPNSGFTSCGTCGHFMAHSPFQKKKYQIFISFQLYHTAVAMYFAALTITTFTRGTR